MTRINSERNFSKIPPKANERFLCSIFSKQLGPKPKGTYRSTWSSNYGCLDDNQPNPRSDSAKDNQDSKDDVVENLNPTTIKPWTCRLSLKRFRCFQATLGADLLRARSFLLRPGFFLIAFQSVMHLNYIFILDYEQKCI